MKPKKSYGQHFLTRPEIATRIANCIDIDTDYILEVGPGQGILTEALLKLDKPILAVEADKEMVWQLQYKYVQDLKLKIIHANFLKFNPLEDRSDQTFVLAGNFPYNISSQIIFQLIKYKEHCPLMVGMFQKELADRLLAKPGNKVYGAITVLLQLYYGGKKLFNLEPGAFHPPPKVKSSVIYLYRKASIPDINYTSFRQVVKSSFGQRRKKMRNTIGHLFSKDTVENMAVFQKRPEELSVTDFVELTKMMEVAK
jgi:16S rRNA (adenine1518-N6/adenine1519-N6)-dimethyltransferase